MWPQYGYYQPRPRGMFSFSKQEMREIGISIVVLTLAFAMAFSGGIPTKGEIPYFLYFALPIAFLAVITGFFLHEMGHRLVARHYGCWAEFRMWSFGLVLAIFTSMLGALFAAPGAVYISGFVTKDQNGKISAAGPLMNVFVALVMFPLVAFGGVLIGGIAYFIAWINIFLAGFNLIPFPPLDGSKILGWGIPYYLGMVFLVVSTYIGLDYLASL